MITVAAVTTTTPPPTQTTIMIVCIEVVSSLPETEISKFRIVNNLLGKSCPLGFSLMLFFYFSAVFNVGVRLVFKTGCGIRLYRFLIIAFLSTIKQNVKTILFLLKIPNHDRHKHKYK